MNCTHRYLWNFLCLWDFINAFFLKTLEDWFSNEEKIKECSRTSVLILSPELRSVLFEVYSCICDHTHHPEDIWWPLKCADAVHLLFCGLQICVSRKHTWKRYAEKFQPELNRKWLMLLQCNNYLLSMHVLSHLMADLERVSSVWRMWIGSMQVLHLAFGYCRNG